ncbi:MAG: helix-turn-helix domain-containing protein [Thermoplasmatales archaeon]|nr:helix-turn-helix domain-containing protein [Thermoplasmatales archaeon]MCW6170341.1 helix-turn-helix domain-containing protein [Thermoplasmatales archaeon]
MYTFSNGEEIFGLVDFSIIHYGCWSGATKYENVTAHTILCKPISSKGKIVAGIEIRVPSKHVFKSFLKDLRGSKKVTGVMDIKTLNGQGTFYRILFTEEYDGMVASVLSEYGSIFQENIVKNNVERVISILPKNDLKDFKSKLEIIGRITSFRSISVDIDNYLPSMLALTEKEIMTISIANSLGYYMFPKEATLQDIAIRMGISASTAHEYLSKAEKKLISKTLPIFSLAAGERRST